MASRTTGANQTTLIKDDTAPVNLSQIVSSTLFVREPAFTKESVWVNGLGQQVLTADNSAPVNYTSVLQRTLVVTQAAVGIDASYANHASHQVIFSELAGLVHGNAVSQQVLVVTERPPGSDAVNSGTAVHLTLIVEPAFVKSSTALQQVLLVTEPAPPLSAVNISSVKLSALVEEPPAPAKIGQVRGQAIVLLEGPILTAGTGQVLHSTLALDLERGKTHTNGAAQHTLLLTEAKSRDPDRTKVLTITSTHTKSYAHPSTFASLHRARLMVRNDVLSTKFKDPTVVATAYRAKILVSETAKSQEFVDPRDLAAKIQAGTLEISAAVKTPYPEHVISDAVTQSAYQEVAQKWNATNPIAVHSDSVGHQLLAETAVKSMFLSPLDVRSPTWTASSFAEVATKSPAIDPNSYRTEKRPLQIAHMSAMFAELTVDPIDLKSKNQVSVLDIATAHHSTEYPKDVQSDTEAKSLSTQVLSVSQYISPTDPIFKSMIHLNRLKFEALVYSNMIQDPEDVQSPAVVRQLSVRHAVQAAFLAPEQVISTNVVSELYTGVACEKVMLDPAGVKPTRQMYALAFSSAYGVDRYNIMPTSMISVQRVKTEAASPVTLRNPSDLGVTDRAYLLGILTAVKVSYTDPENTKPKRRISSARVTRK